MAGPEAKKTFGSIRSQYSLYGAEKDFREIQKQVALKRIRHEEVAPAASAENGIESS